MALPFDQVFIGDSYAMENWCPGITRSPCSIAATTSGGGLTLPLLPIQACPSGFCLTFTGSVWPVGQGSGTNVPNNREGLTARGGWADHFNGITGLNLSDANMHFFARSGSTAGLASDTTGLWNDPTSTSTWLMTETLGSNAGSGKTALDIIRFPPTGRVNVVMSCTGNDWLKYHEQSTGQKIMDNQTAMDAVIQGWQQQVLNIIYNANPHAYVDWFGYINLPLGEADGTQYDGNAFAIGYPEDAGHKGLASTASYPNPPGTQFCPQLSTPFRTPDNITSLPNLPSSISSTAFPRYIHTATFATDFNQRNNVDLAPWYAHWFADKNTPNLDSQSNWDNRKGFGNGIAAAAGTNTFGAAFVTQDISNDRVNAQWQLSLNSYMDNLRTSYRALGFNINTYKTWTIMNDFGTQLGTDKPATQSMNKFGFCDGFLHPSATASAVLVQRQIALWRSTSPLADSLHGMKLTISTVGVASVKIYGGVPGNTGQDRVYVNVSNPTGGSTVYIGDANVTNAAGVLPGIPIAAGATKDFVVYGGDDLWAISDITGATISILRTGRS